MNTIEIPSKGIVREFPSSWQEMTPKQIRFVMKTYSECIVMGKSPLEFNIRVLYNLARIKRTAGTVIWEKLNPMLTQERNSNIYLLCERSLGFLFSENDKSVLSFNAVVNALPIIRVGILGKRLVGPANLLQNLTFGEFRHAATALNRFFKTGDTADLNECITFLYRRESNKMNRAGRNVVSIDYATISKNVRLAEKIPDWKKNLLVLWFSACINYLQTGVINIDGEDIDMSQLFSGDGGKSGITQTWSDLLIQIAKEQVVGNVSRVDEEPLFSIFSIMWHNHKENKRYEAGKQSN